MQDTELMCTYAEHEQRPVQGICINCDCDKLRPVCFMCTKDFHRSHLNDLMDISKFKLWREEGLVISNQVKSIVIELESVTFLLREFIKQDQPCNNFNLFSPRTDEINCEVKHTLRLQQLSTGLSKELEKLSECLQIVKVQCKNLNPLKDIGQLERKTSSNERSEKVPQSLTARSRTEFRNTQNQYQQVRDSEKLYFIQKQQDEFEQERHKFSSQIFTIERLDETNQSTQGSQNTYFNQKNESQTNNRINNTKYNQKEEQQIDDRITLTKMQGGQTISQKQFQQPQLNSQKIERCDLIYNLQNEIVMKLTLFRIETLQDSNEPNVKLTFQFEETNENYVGENEIEMLKSGQTYINSSIINAYINHLKMRDETSYFSLVEEERKKYKRLFIFGSQFITNCALNKAGTNFSKELLDKKYLYLFLKELADFKGIQYQFWVNYKKIGVFINVTNYWHWYFMKIKYEKRLLVVFDSMTRNPQSYERVRILFSYLFQQITGDTNYTFSIKISDTFQKQRDGYSCGYYACIAADLLSQRKPKHAKSLAKIKINLKKLLLPSNTLQLQSEFQKQAIKTLEEKNKQLEKKESCYIGTQFPPNTKSLGYYSAKLVWKRLFTIISSEPNENNSSGFSFEEWICINKLQLAFFGCQFFFVSITALNNSKPKHLYKIFNTKIFNKYGYYGFNICQDGEFKLIEIDDYLPMLDDKPQITRGQNDEIWVMMILKALAKALGSYKSVMSSNPSEVLNTLTGAPTKVIQPSDENFNQQLQEAIQGEYIIICKIRLNYSQYIQIVPNKNQSYDSKLYLRDTDKFFQQYGGLEAGNSTNSNDIVEITITDFTKYVENVEFENSCDYSPVKILLFKGNELLIGNYKQERECWFSYNLQSGQYTIVVKAKWQFSSENKYNLSIYGPANGTSLTKIPKINTLLDKALLQQARNSQNLKDYFGNPQIKKGFDVIYGYGFFYIMNRSYETLSTTITLAQQQGIKPRKQFKSQPLQITLKSGEECLSLYSVNLNCDKLMNIFGDIQNQTPIGDK